MIDVLTDDGGSMIKLYDKEEGVVEIIFFLLDNYVGGGKF